jgi:TPR repeat protein
MVRDESWDCAKTNLLNGLLSILKGSFYRWNVCESGFDDNAEGSANASGLSAWNIGIHQRNLENLRLLVDQGNADSQWRYGLCLRDGTGISKDLRGAAHYFKLSADQGNADSQWRYGLCRRDGNGISKDLKGAAHYFKCQLIKDMLLVNVVMVGVCRME